VLIGQTWDPAYPKLCSSEIADLTEEKAMKVSTILDSIDLGSISLPEFQRG